MRPHRANSSAPPLSTRRAARRAFSLIELVMVLTILGILSAIAVPRYAGALARYRADAAARQIISFLDHAREHARSTSTSVEVAIRANKEKIKLNDITSPDDPSKDWQILISDAPFYADLVSHDFSSDKVTFDGYGYPDQSGTIKISVGVEARSIYLDAGTGKAVVQ